MNNNHTINLGICEGIVVGEIFQPTEDIAILTVKTRDHRVRPNTQKQTISYIQFTAFDDVARSIANECNEGQLVYINYELSTSRKMDENGVSKFYKNRIVKKIDFFNKPEEGQHIPYINWGIAQGSFVGIKKASKSTGIYFLTIKLSSFENGKEKVCFPQFTVYGDSFAELFNKYSADDTISITYKIETEKKNIDGKESFFTDYIVTEVK